MINNQKKMTLRSVLTEKNLIMALTVVVTCIIIAGLITTVICIIAARPVGDDFGAINFYRSDVWLTNTIESLKTTGRYGQSVFGSIAYGLLGRQVATLLPAFTIMWMTALLYLFIEKALDCQFSITKRRRMISAALAATITFLILFVNNNISFGKSPTWISYQYLFWPAGIVTYATPILLFASIIYLLFIRTNKIGRIQKIVIFSLATFLIGLFNEIVPATIIILSSGMLFLSFFKKLRWIMKDKTFYVTAALSSIIAITALVFSAGSQSRQATTGVQHRDIIMLILSTGYHVYVTFSQLIFRLKDLTLIMSVGIIIAAIIRKLTNNNSQQIKALSERGMILGIITLVAMLGTMSCSYLLVAVGYGEHCGIITRTIFVPQILYVVGLMLFTSSLFIYIKPEASSVARRVFITYSIILVLAYCPQYIQKINDQLRSSVNYSRAWTQQEAIIKKKLSEDKDQTIYLPDSVKGIGVDQTLSCMGTPWLNYQIAEYYGVKKICSDKDPRA